MVELGELDDARGSAGAGERIAAAGAVRKATVHGAPEGEAGALGGEGVDQPGVAGEHVDHAVGAALVALADIVEEAGGHEVRVGVAALDEPARGGRGVHDIAGVLGGEEVEEFGTQVLAGEGVVGGRGLPPGVPELAEAFAHV